MSPGETTDAFAVGAVPEIFVARVPVGFGNDLDLADVAPEFDQVASAGSSSSSERSGARPRPRYGIRVPTRARSPRSATSR